jgi:hypothetical protein
LLSISRANAVVLAAAVVFIAAVDIDVAVVFITVVEMDFAVVCYRCIKHFGSHKKPNFSYFYGLLVSNV